MNRRPIGARRRPPAREHKRRLAHKVAEFINAARAAGMSNTALLIAIDKQFPGLLAHTLISAHFIDQVSSQKGRLQ
jgi:hypothetical protein